jgi:hypothetical protein
MWLTFGAGIRGACRPSRMKRAKTKYTAVARHWTVADREAHKRWVLMRAGEMHGSANGAGHEDLKGSRTIASAARPGARRAGRRPPVLCSAPAVVTLRRSTLHYLDEAPAEGDRDETAYEHYPSAGLRNELEVRTDKGVARQTFREDTGTDARVREVDGAPAVINLRV